MSIPPSEVEHALPSFPARLLGSGGAITVVRDGSTGGQRVWGSADLEAKIPMTPETMMPICSISKQLFCALALDLQRDRSDAGDAGRRRRRAAAAAAAILPQARRAAAPSGLRDDRALTTLWGARPEDAFSMARLTSLHFAPGTEYSYADTDPQLLGRILERGGPGGSGTAAGAAQPFEVAAAAPTTTTTTTTTTASAHRPAGVLAGDVP
ncbi:Beta-lactamase/transpeptidase-like protein [Moelleriella libera RCEF 2490]|uniref:Beta-lactamase/transpeptidase-like protein n=1 Tax=Moelleriella libera RCEF 2490 TaxID=1081109 RepID=A0A167YCJ8_9HYPO|nr:Beta-lactamase/transpeptidase-like protein [Moelleriella libera RCEF 2490]